jgi:predicted RNase H-like HicB family nuclease
MPKRKFTIFLIPTETGVYQAISPFYPGCITDGDTPEEALENARDAMEGILHAEAKSKDPWPVPPYVHPSHVVVGEIDVEVPENLIEDAQKQPARQDRR